MNESVASIPDGSPSDYQTLVLGLGNVLWADEGFGVRCVEALNAAFRAPGEVRLMDGGTQGIFLIPWVRAASNLLILDAVDYGMAPGTLKVVHGDDVPRFMGVRKVSMHQAGFQEVLMSAKLTGDFPHRIALVGVQPELLNDYGGSLTDTVRARVPEAVSHAVKVLESWDIVLSPRDQPPGRAELTGPRELEMGSYESGRPPQGVAKP